MQSSESSASPKKPDTAPSTPPVKRAVRAGYQAALVWLLRLVLGATLTFSGFVKAVDPWGGLYKINDYFGAWHIDATHEGALMAACLLASFEFVLGVIIIAGLYRKTVGRVTTIFMAFMTLLTLYILIADPVEDCGCFGDAVKLSNPITFAKNVVLLFLAWMLMKFNRLAEPLIRPRLQWLALVFTTFYIFAIQIYGYHIQPLIDFRPYPVGTDMAEKVAGYADDGEDESITFVYEKDGVRQSFTADSLPGDDWTFVERQTVAPASVSVSDAMLTVLDEHGDDVTDIIFGRNNNNMDMDGNLTHTESSTPLGDTEAAQDDSYLLVVSDPERYGMARSESANRLYDFAEKHGSRMMALVAVDPDRLESWRSMTGALYPAYSAEDTDLKMLARGDAAIVALKDGRITWKTNIFALPPEFPDMNDAAAFVEYQTKGTPTAMITFIWLLAMTGLYIISRYIRHLAPEKPNV